MPTLDWLAYGEMGLVVLAAACVQGVGGIGFAMFAAPIAGLFFPILAPGPLLLLGGTVSLFSALRESRAIDWGFAGHGIAGRAAGSVLAAGLLAVASPQALSIAYAAMLLAAVALALAGWMVAPTRRNAGVAGIVSGVMGTITSAGAPPFALLAQRMEPPRIRATVGCILAVGATVSLLLLAGIGHFSAEQLRLSVLLLPWVVAGFLLSGRLARLVPAHRVRHLLLAMVGFSAIAILMKALG